MEERFEISFEWHDSVLCVFIAGVAGRLDARAPDLFTQNTDIAISEAGGRSQTRHRDFGLQCAGVYQWTWPASRLVARPRASWPWYSGVNRRVAGRAVRHSRPSRLPRFSQNIPDHVRSARLARVIPVSPYWRGRPGQRPD